jgi:integrase
MALLSETTEIGFHKRDGVYYGSIRDPKTNKVKTKTAPKSEQTPDSARTWLIGYETRLWAEHAAAQKAAEIPSVPTLRLLLPMWENYLKTERTNRDGKALDDQTIRKWMTCIKHHALSKLGDLPLTNQTLTPYVVVSWVENLKKTCTSTYYVRDCVHAVRQFVADARKKRWVDLYANPFADEMVQSEVPQAAPLSGRNNPIHLTLAATITLLTCKVSIPLAERVITLVALCTGLRIRELQGLAWRHIDLEAGTLEVERQVKKGGADPQFKAPKKDSYRTLPLHPLAIRALEFWKKQFPTIDPEGPVFPRKGSWDVFEMWGLSPGSAATFRRNLKLAGLPDCYEGKHQFDFHSTRRTFMTLLDQAGAADDKIGALAGHAKKGVRRHYVRENLETFKPVIAMLPFGDINPAWLPAPLKEVA